MRRQNRRAGDGRKDEPNCYTGYCQCDAVSAFRACLPESISDVAVYTRTDGVVDWRFCINDDSAKNVEVAGTHTGLAFNPQVYRLIGRATRRLHGGRRIRPDRSPLRLAGPTRPAPPPDTGPGVAGLPSGPRCPSPEPHEA